MITWDDLALSSPVAVYEKSVETNIELTDYGEFLRHSMLDGDVWLPKVQAEEPLKAQAIAFRRAIVRGTPECADGEFGLGVVQVLARIKDSLSRREGVA